MGRRSAVLAGADVSVRFGLCDVEAAAALGIGLSLFHQMVGDGRMPRPRMINARKVWDIDELRAAFKRLPHDGPEILRANDDDKWSRVVT